jgi:replicative DNA helicase
MPHCEDREKSLLAILFDYPHLIDDFSTLTPEHFYLGHTRRFFEIIREMHGRGKVLDLVEIIPALSTEGILEKMGGAGELVEMCTTRANPAVAGQLRETLTDLLARRIAITAARRLEEAAFDRNTPEAYLEAAGEPITAIYETVTESKPAPNAKALGREFYENYQKLLKGEKEPFGLRTGIPEIDGALRGLHPGMMGVISAKSSGGKSTLATQIFSNMGRDEIKVAYFPLEGTTQAAYTRCVIQLSGLHHKIITAPLEWSQLQGRQMITKDEKGHVERAIRTITNGCFHFDPPANRKIETIISAIRRAHRKHGIEVAFVDYIQLIHGTKSRSKEDETANVSHALQELAGELGITVVVMSQENDNGETKHARAIEEDCDWWLSVVQHQDRTKENFKEHRHVLISKDRHNSQGGRRLPLQLDKELIRFVHREEEQDKPIRKHF